MPILNDRCTSFLAECLQGTHLLTDTYKLVLLKPGAAGTYSHATTNAGTPGSGAPSTGNVGTDEASGSGYPSGGITLGAPSVSINGRVVRWDFPDPAPFVATLSAIGGVIVNATRGNKAVAVVDFGGTVSATGGDFAVNFPDAGDETSLIRIG